jgi:hypothetical protein
MPAFTVIGLIDNNSGELLVAGVVPGEVGCLDSFETEGFTRWADSFEADGTDEAEHLAHQQVASS